ncbi:MAG: thiamine pyrophosphate-binding protein [Desulfobacterales bacterium]|nr:thiamine pyrophosphate-binding protein [Desulfobacterales bacterium]
MTTVRKGAKASQAKYGSDVIVDMMKAYDIEYVAFNPGATFRGIHDSILNYGGNRKPEVIFCCHEEHSVAICHGYAKAKGKPMVAITHNIVGLQHASMAIFNAWCDRVPVIVLGGTGPMDTTRRRPWIDWVHTALVQGNQVRDYVKWDDQPYSLNAIPASFVRGYRIATTEPQGPVYICYDADLQENAITDSPEMLDVTRFSPPAPMQANPEALNQAARLLVNAQSPLIIADYLGRNPKSVDSLVELAELLAIPVMDKGGRFNFPNTHPLDITGGAKEFLQKADVILALDVQDLYGSLVTLNRTTRVTGYVTEPSTKIIHISLNDMLVRSWAADYQCLQAVDVPICADTSIALPELIRLCGQLSTKNKKKKASIEARFKQVKRHHDTLRKKSYEAVNAQSAGDVISVPFLAQQVWEAVKGEDWVLANTGLKGWPRRLWDWTKPYQYIGSSAGAGLGYGLSAAMGAALAHKGTGKLCVDIQPDGDYLMTASALYTAAHHKIPLLIVMHNNRSFYNSEEHNMQIAEFRGRSLKLAGIGTHMENPAINYAKLAEGFGLYGAGPITRPEDLGPALIDALKVVQEKKLPALVDVVSASR